MKLGKLIFIPVFFFIMIIAANAQIIQFGGSASCRTFGPGSPLGIYTAECSISFANNFNLFGGDSDFNIFTVNAGAQFNPSISGDTRFFTELVYWKYICLGAGFTAGPQGGSFHLMIGEMIPFGLVNTGVCFLPPVVVFYLRPTWENASEFYLDLGIKLKFTIPVNLADL
ncbi:MAG: hypothetical protein EHM28_01550 [Spirochaetaceae bacterium]|nr:MAG: hypothetical protein EHM28_01550 [Spirochaetaceae bacterium]